MIKDQQSTLSLPPENTEDPSDLELGDSPVSPSQTVVRRTKTKTQSRILGNGDLVEQTVVTEVTETVTTLVRCDDCRARCPDNTEKINTEEREEREEREEEEELDEETVSELIEESDSDESTVPVDRDKELEDPTPAPPATAFRKMGIKLA